MRDVANREWVARDFKRTTREHELEVLHDEGLYRHLRCAAPRTYCYGFDIITWPGHLVIAGDIGDWTFQRVDDMFSFFRSDGGRINPDYWSEKVQVGAGGGGSRATRTFSRDRVYDVLRDWAQGACSDWGIHGEITWDFHNAMYPDLLYGALERELRRRDEIGSVESAVRVFEEIESDVRFDTRLDGNYEVNLGLTEMWEYDYTEFESSFLRCCYAIVKAIGMYDEARMAVA